VATFAGPRFALTRGQVLVAAVRRAAGTDPPAVATLDGVATGDTVVAPAPSHPGVGAAPTAAPVARGPLPRTPRLSGYMTTETRWIRQANGGAAESHGTPSATLSLRAMDLPARSAVYIYARAVHNGAGPSAPAGQPATELRVYSARVESHAGPLRIAVGRLTSTHDPAAGLWDGVSLGTGDRLAVAVGAGYERSAGRAHPPHGFHGCPCPSSHGDGRRD
jgi:hypothetical protein